MTFNVGLASEGPGLMLRNLVKGAHTERLLEIATLKPDILAVQGFDYDDDRLALAAFQAQLKSLNHEMPYAVALAPNSGLPTGFDLNRNERLEEPEDAQGYGEFLGQGGIALLSRFPVLEGDLKNFTGLRWADVDWATPPDLSGTPYFTPEEWVALPLFSVAAWAVPVDTPDGQLWVLTGQSSPPVFDGPENRNGLRNAAQLEFWSRVVAGAEVAGWSLPSDRWVFAGGLNADPADGEGPKPELHALLTAHHLQDPEPSSQAAAEDPDPDHLGDPALDTVRWRRDRGPGNLRVDYVLPSAQFDVLRSGVHWSASRSDDDLFRHFPVWVDIRW